MVVTGTLKPKQISTPKSQINTIYIKHQTHLPLHHQHRHSRPYQTQHRRQSHHPHQLRTSQCQQQTHQPTNYLHPLSNRYLRYSHRLADFNLEYHSQ